MATKVTLLDNASATGSAASWTGGRGFFSGVGTFGGGTITLQILGPDGTTYVPVTSPEGTAIALTAAGGIWFVAPAGSLRAAVSGGTPSALYANAVRA